jgi:protein gp37
MGARVGNEKDKSKIGCVHQTAAKIRFLALEPLIDPLGKLNLKKINWVIVGGESGPGARPILQEWVTDIRDECLRANVPFFFKQWGGVQKK